MSIAVLGAGGWGTALAVMLHQHGRKVKLWARRENFAEELRRERINHSYLPGVTLPEDLTITSDLNAALYDSQLVLLVVPSVGVAELLAMLPRHHALVLCAKGLAEGGERLSEQAHKQGFEQVAVLSGPNHAEEIARTLPAASVVASQDAALALQAQEMLHTSTFRVYRSSDVVGVELGGVLKNVIALAAGMIDGLRLGDNAKAALLTRALKEMQRYLVSQGANEDTVFGLSGLGDLIATCTSPHSRNRKAGELIASGENPAQGGKVVEGIRSAKLLHTWAKHHSEDLPIVEAVYGVISGKLSPQAAIKFLMERSAKAE